MLNKIIEKILGAVGKKLDGVKTKIGGVGFVLLGILGLIKVMFPDMEQLPTIGAETSLGLIAGGFTALGIGGKADKQKDAIVAQTAVIRQQNELVEKQLASASPPKGGNEIRVPPLPVGEGKGEGRSGRIEDIRPAD